MSFRNFVPEIWSNKILSKLRAAHVYGQAGVVNRDYEGEVQAFGQTVRINQVGEVTIFDYTANTDITAPQELSDTQRTLVIDTQKAFNFQLDDIDQAQAQGTSGVLAQAFESAGFGLSGVLDAQISGKMALAATGSLAVGTTAAPTALFTAANIYTNLFLDARTKLTKANVPMDGRYIVLPPELVAIALSDDKYVLPSTQYEPVLNGEVGKCAGLRIIESNTVPTGTGAGGPYWRIIASHSMSTSLAEQIVKVEPFRMEKRFADAVKGLHVYGSKVIRPELVYCNTVHT